MLARLQVPRLVALVLTAPVATSLLATLALGAALESPAAVLLRPFLGDVPQLLLRYCWVQVPPTLVLSIGCMPLQLLYSS